MTTKLLHAVVNGVLGGGVYALMAVGLTLIFGVLDIINIAQGIMVVLGAYLSSVLWTDLHIDVFVGLLITIPAMFILGVAIQYLFIRPLRGRERTSMSLLACYAVAIITEKWSNAKSRRSSGCWRMAKRWSVMTTSALAFRNLSHPQADIGISPLSRAIFSIRAA